MQRTSMNTRDTNISSPKLDAVVGEMGCLGRDTNISFNPNNLLALHVKPHEAFFVF